MSDIGLASISLRKAQSWLESLNMMEVSIIQRELTTKLWRITSCRTKEWRDSLELNTMRRKMPSISLGNCYVIQWYLHPSCSWDVHPRKQRTPIRVQSSRLSCERTHYHWRREDLPSKGYQILAWCPVQCWRCRRQLLRMAQELVARQPRQNVKKVGREDQEQSSWCDQRGNWLECGQIATFKGSNWEGHRSCGYWRSDDPSHQRSHRNFSWTQGRPENRSLHQRNHQDPWILLTLRHSGLWMISHIEYC